MLAGWKTVLFNSIAAVLLVLQTTDYATLLPPEHGWIAAVIVAVVNLALRFFTATPIGKAS